VTESMIRDRNTRLGLRLFLLYALFYLAFVLVNAFAPAWGEWKVIAGLNLAVTWGFALIVFAFVLALIYGVLCGRGVGNSPSDSPTAAQPDTRKRS
jgi:uncharacterized membrane protein (DUF485 family)